MVKKVMANYYGHEILVVNGWFTGTKLFINGEFRAENRALFALTTNKPFLTTELELKGQSHTIEVFCRALLTVEIKICVDGQQIGGEVF
jgi:hypothetical protein